MSKLESYFSSTKHARLATMPAHTAELTASNEFSLKLQHLDREENHFLQQKITFLVKISTSFALSSHTAVSWISTKWMWKDDLSVSYMYRKLNENSYSSSPLSLESHCELHSNLYLQPWKLISLGTVFGLDKHYHLFQADNSYSKSNELNFIRRFNSSVTRNCQNTWF